MFVPYDVKTSKELFESAFLVELLLSCWNCYGLVSASLSLWKKKKNLQVLPSSIIMTCKWFYSSYINFMKLNVYILPEAKQNLWSGSWKRNVDPSRAPIATNSVSMSFTALQQTSKLYRRQPWGHRHVSLDSTVTSPMNSNDASRLRKSQVHSKRFQKYMQTDFKLHVAGSFR